MCLVRYEICQNCFQGHAEHIETCDHFHPPSLRCPVGTEFKFSMSGRCHALLHPDHSPSFNSAYNHQSPRSGSVFEIVGPIWPRQEASPVSTHSPAARTEDRASQTDVIQFGFGGIPSSTHGYNQHIQGSHRLNGQRLSNPEFVLPTPSQSQGDIHHDHCPTTGLPPQSRPPLPTMFRYDIPGGSSILPDSRYQAHNRPHQSHPGYSQPPLASRQTLYHVPRFAYTSARGASQNYLPPNPDQILPRHMRSHSSRISEQIGPHWQRNPAPSWEHLSPMNNGFRSRHEVLRDDLEQLRRSNEAAYYPAHRVDMNGSSPSHGYAYGTTRDTSLSADSPQREPENGRDVHGAPHRGKRSISRQRSASVPHIMVQALHQRPSSTIRERSGSHLGIYNLPHTEVRDGGTVLENTVETRNDGTPGTQSQQETSPHQSEEDRDLGWDRGEVAYLSLLAGEEEVTNNESGNASNGIPAGVSHDISIKKESEDDDQRVNRGDSTSRSIKSDPESETTLYDVPSVRDTAQASDHDQAGHGGTDGVEDQPDPPDSLRQSPTVFPQPRRSWSDVVSGRHTSSAPTSSDPSPTPAATDTYAQCISNINALRIAIRRLVETPLSTKGATQSPHNHAITAFQQPYTPAPKPDKTATATRDPLRIDSARPPAIRTQPTQGPGPATRMITEHPSPAVHTAQPNTPTARTPTVAPTTDHPNNDSSQRTWSQILFTRPASSSSTRPKKPPNLKPRSESGVDETNWPALGSSPGLSKRAQKRNPSS